MLFPVSTWNFNFVHMLPLLALSSQQFLSTNWPLTTVTYHSLSTLFISELLRLTLINSKCIVICFCLLIHLIFLLLERTFLLLSCEKWKVTTVEQHLPKCPFYSKCPFSSREVQNREPSLFRDKACLLLTVYFLLRNSRCTCQQ